MGWVSHGEYTSVYDAHWIGFTVSYDLRLSIVMIHQTTMDSQPLEDIESLSNQ